MEKTINITKEANPMLFAYCMHKAEKFTYDANIGFGYPYDYNYSPEEVHICGKIYSELVSGYMPDFGQEYRCVNRIYAKV